MFRALFFGKYTILTVTSFVLKFALFNHLSCCSLRPVPTLAIPRLRLPLQFCSPQLLSPLLIQELQRQLNVDHGFECERALKEQLKLQEQMWSHRGICP